MYNVLWFIKGNILKKRACFYYRKPAMALAEDWGDDAIGKRDSVQVYDDGVLIWVDGRDVSDIQYSILNLDRARDKLRAL